MIREYFLMYYDKLVAIIDCKNNLPDSMEIINPCLFFHKYEKNVMSGDKLKEWIKNRVTPENQIGLQKLLIQLNININDDNWHWNLLLKTKAINVKDKLWLSETEFVEPDDNPWYDMQYSSEIEDIDKDSDLLNIFESKTKLNIYGSSEKKLVRINGEIAILKKSLENNVYDSVAEDLIYKIAKRLGVKCAPTAFLKQDICYSVIDGDKDLIQGCDVLNLEDYTIEEAYKKLVRLNCDKNVLVDFLRMNLFDVLTRQLDRNVTNFSFYRNNERLRLYSLYDNGLSLFSSTKFNSNEDFKMKYEHSDKIRKFAINKLRQLGINKPFPCQLTEDFLQDIFEAYREVIKNKNGNNIDDIINWIYCQYNLIIKKWISNK